MSAGALTYRGLADLIITYGEASGLGRTVERPGIEVVLSRTSPSVPVSVLVDPLGADLLKAPGVTRAQVLLPDGRLFVGAVGEVSELGDYFELSAVSPAHPRNGHE